MIVAAVDDLMFGSKIRAACERAGREVVFVRHREAALAEVAARRARTVILDLDREAFDPVGLIRTIRADESMAGVRILAFVRHTSTDLIVAARQAGADAVLARSAFFPALPEWLQDAPEGASSDR
jgi:DNA-binding response OmpR family regulator